MYRLGSYNEAPYLLFLVASQLDPDMNHRVRTHELSPDASNHSRATASHSASGQEPPGRKTRDVYVAPPARSERARRPCVGAGHSYKEGNGLRVPGN